MHKKIMKRSMLVLMLAACLFFSGCSDDSVQKETIFEYVVKNINVLSAFPYSIYKSSTNYETEIPFIQDVLGQDTIVKSVYQYDSSILGFYCGGTGIVTSSTYCGFYYSREDMPYAFEFESEAQFTQISDNVYEWQSEDRQRAVYTERIQPNWFWYQMIWD